MHPNRPVIAEVIIPVGDFPWHVQMENGRPRRYYSDLSEPMIETKGMPKTYGLNREGTHVVFKFHNIEDMPRIIVFKMKWGRK